MTAGVGHCHFRSRMNLADGATDVNGGRWASNEDDFKPVSASSIIHCKNTTALSIDMYDCCKISSPSVAVSAEAGRYFSTAMTKYHCVLNDLFPALQCPNTSVSPRAVSRLRYNRNTLLVHKTSPLDAKDWVAESTMVSALGDNNADVVNAGALAGL